MSSIATICEFNPLHNGHQKLLSAMRNEVGVQGTVICIMSGHAVQRGSFSVFDKYVRAEAALACGADLVLELPFPWSAANAEDFAKGGVAIAKALGINKLMFGSECGDLQLIKELAQSLDEYQTEKRNQDTAAPNIGEAARFSSWLESKSGRSLGPNDRLGIAYLRALVGTDIEPKTIFRADSHDQPDAKVDNPSASSIREAMREKVTFEKEAVPPIVAELYQKALSQNQLFSDWPGALGQAVLVHYRTHGSMSTYGMDSGLTYRIEREAKTNVSFDDFFEALKTKRYTDAHLRRVLLYGICGVSSNDLDQMPAYTTLLAANERGKSFLSEKRKSINDFYVVTKPADVPTTSRCKRQAEMDEQLEGLFTLCKAVPQPAGIYRKARPIVEGKQG